MAASVKLLIGKGGVDDCGGCSAPKQGGWTQNIASCGASFVAVVEGTQVVWLMARHVFFFGLDATDEAVELQAEFTDPCSSCSKIVTLLDS